MASSMRQAFRGVRRSPGFASAVVITLGLGIGVNTVMFGVVDRLLLSPPAQVAEPDQVRRVLREGRFFTEHDVLPIATYPDVVDLRTVPEFAAVGGVAPVRVLTLATGEAARRVRTIRATHDFFTTLGVRAHLGRFFDRDEDRIDAQGTVVLSYEFWEDAFAADSEVLGRTLDLAGHPMSVIGVAPRGFTGVDLSPVDVWLPAVTAQAMLSGSDRFLTSRSYWWLRAVVRARDDASLDAGESRATALHLNGRANQLEQDRFDRDARIITAPLVAARGPEATNESKVARWLAGVSLIVLLIACANVANLLLARGAGRKREVAVRLALGVPRGRLIGEVFAETLILALLGGCAAVGLALSGGRIIRAGLIPDVLWTESGLGGRVIAFTAVTSVAASLLAGLGPALQSSAADLNRDLVEGGRGSSVRRSRVLGSLTVVQTTLSVVLLVGAGLFIRSVVEVRRLDLGLDVDRLIQVKLEFQGEAPDPVEQTRLYQEAMEVVSATPGVAGVAGTDVLYQEGVIEDINVPGLDSLPVPPRGGPFYYGVSPGYLATMGLELLRGRRILESDAEAMPKVAVVNQMMARRLWPGREALGQCFQFAGAEECTTVVGVMEDASWANLEDPPHLAYLLPLLQVAHAPAGLYIRTDSDARELAARVAPALRSFSSRVRFAEVQTLRRILDPQTRAFTLGATLFSAFGGLALLVAAIGLYSVLAFDIARRTKELGIRAALGARRPQILREVLLSGMRLTVVGVATGTAAALVAGRFAGDLLFHVSGRDPWVLGTVALTLMFVAFAASFVPGLRATRVDPMEALRTE